MSVLTTANHRLLALLTTLGVLLGTDVLASEPVIPAPSPSPARAASSGEGPTYIILPDTNDMTGLLKGLPAGSMVVKTEQAEGSKAAARPRGSAESSSHVVKGVRITGKVVDERAELEIDMEINLREDGPAWIPIRLDGKALFTVREGGRDLLSQCPNDKQWEVRLQGKGLHRIRVELKVILKSILDRSVLELDIPGAASTSIELEIPQRVADASAGLNEPVGQVALGPSKGYRLTAHLPPRSKLELSWRKETGSAAERQPLLSVQGEIAIDAELESLRTRSSWLVRCVRGSTQSLEITLDNQDEILEVFLDDQVIRYETERVGRASLLKIPLAEALATGGSRRLVFLTRRPIAREANAWIAFRGFAFSHAKDQSGAIALFPGVNLWANVKLGPGVLQINGSEMPADLRSRPGTPLAFQFLDQPFEINVAIESSPPLANAETRTVLRVGPDVVRQETWVEIQRIRGRLFEVEIGIPDGLQLTSCGPLDLIEPSSQSSNAGIEKLLGEANQTKLLKIRLNAQAMDQKKLTLHLEGYQRYRPSESTRIGLFHPRNLIEIASRIAVISSRDLSVEAGEEVTQAESGIDHAFSSDEDSLEWPWPGVRPETGRPQRFLMTQGLPKSLPIRVTKNPRIITQDVTLSARIGRGGLQVQQQTECEIRHAAARSLELLVPAGIDEWETVGPEGTKREEIEHYPAGERRYRLVLPTSASDRVTLRFRYQTRFKAKLDSKSKIEASVPWIDVSGATPKGVQVDFTADPGVRLEPASPGWTNVSAERAVDPARPGNKLSSSFRIDQPGDGAPTFLLKAWAAEHATLPRTLCGRMFIRTSYGFDRLLHNRAWLTIEKHGPHVDLEPPPGSRLVRVVADGRVLDPEEIELGEDQAFCRILAYSENQPILLELEYDTPDLSGVAWSPPRLRDDAKILETFWEIVLPWNMAMIGSPAGWTDDNQWYWDAWVWRRRPARGIPELLGRMGVDPSDDGKAEEGIADSQNYLFSRTGEAATIRIGVASRPWLIGVCSGAVLLAGFGLIFLPKAKARMLLAGLTLFGLLAGATIHPSTLMVALQSSIIGIVLSLLGLAIQYLIESRRPGWPPERDPAVRVAVPLPGSTMNRRPDPSPSSTRPAEVGSDDSTSIRVRVASTAEYRAKEPTLEEPDQANGPKIELAR